MSTTKHFSAFIIDAASTTTRLRIDNTYSKYSICQKNVKQNICKNFDFQEQGKRWKNKGKPWNVEGKRHTDLGKNFSGLTLISSVQSNSFEGGAEVC